MSTKQTLHFGGGAWSSAYYIGVIRGLQEQYGNDVYKYYKISGDSVGAVLAAGLVLGFSWKELQQQYSTLSTLARKNGVWNGKMTEYHEQMLDSLLCNENHLEKLQSRGFSMGVTSLFSKYKKYDKWIDENHLRRCFHSCFHIPIYCAYQHTLDDIFVLDGGFSNNNVYDFSIGIGETFNISFYPSLK